MFACTYTFIEIGFRGNEWFSGCGKKILYVSELGVGESAPPLPTDNGASFCTFCGKKIKLSEQKPRVAQVSSRPPKPDAAPKPAKPAPTMQPGKNLDTYEGWIARGMQVQRGEKMKGRSPDGVAVFHKDQVKPIEKRSRGFLGGFDDDDFPDIHDY